MSAKRKVDETDSDALDEPTPPGGPNRDDTPQGHTSPGTPASDPGPEVERVTKPEGRGAVPHPEGQRPEQSGDQAERQEENAEESDFGEPSQ